MILSTLVASLATLKVSGWIVFWNAESPTKFAEHADQIDEAMVEWIGVSPVGVPFRRKTETSEQAKLVFETAKRHHVALYAMASNYDKGFDGSRIGLALQDARSQEEHARALVAIAKEDGFAGIDLDYESLRATDRENFSNFVDVLGRLLHEQKLKLSVTVHPKSSEPGTWDGPKAQDWKRLGATADVFRIMCYDQHWAGGSPGPIAEDEWVKQILAFAKTQVAASKIDTGICAYGLDWNQVPTQELTYPAWLAKYPTANGLDPASGEINVDKAWFGGSESATRKMSLTVQAGFRGVAMWYFGSEQPQFWKLVEKRKIR